MSRVKILIVEDEMIVAEDMRSVLEEMSYEIVGVTGEVDEAKRFLLATQPDIALVDITLGVEQQGLNLAKYIIDEIRIPFVFCTSHSDKGTVSEASQLQPNGYLVKPFDDKDLYTAIEIALANFSSRHKCIEEGVSTSENLIIRNTIFIKEGQLYVKVKIEDISWLSPDGNYTNIHERNGKKHVVRMPLKDFHDQLPQDTFFRTHRSFVVNLQHIDAINNQHVIIDNEAIPLGKNYKEDILSQINKIN